MRQQKQKTPALVPEARRRRGSFLRLLFLAATAAGTLYQGVPAAAQEVSDLVSRASLRVCADPADMPMSNREGKGFENEIAELLATSLELPLEYTWYPQATGWYRNTLGGRHCDIALNMVGGADPVQNTNHYYRSSWMLLIPEDDDSLKGIETLSDPRLKGKRLGVIAGTAPSTHLMRLGLMPTAKTYPLMVDRRYDSPSEDMIKDIVDGVIDAGILWGPSAGYYAAQLGAPLTMIPLIKEEQGPPLAYRMTFGVRPGEVNWRRQLNVFIREHQEELHAILKKYNVPLLDEKNQPIAYQTGSQSDPN